MVNDKRFAWGNESEILLLLLQFSGLLKGEGGGGFEGNNFSVLFPKNFWSLEPFPSSFFSVWDAARLFCLNHVHRIPILQVDEFSRETDVLYLLSLRTVFSETVLNLVCIFLSFFFVLILFSCSLVIYKFSSFSAVYLFIFRFGFISSSSLGNKVLFFFSNFFIFFILLLFSIANFWLINERK